MIKSNRSNVSRRRLTDRPIHTVWAERRKTGGYDIYAGIKGSETRTKVGGAMSIDTLDYNLERARHKVRHRN